MSTPKHVMSSDLKLNRHGPVSDLLDALAENPDGAFLITADQKVTVRDFVRRAQNNAGFLHEQGVKAGDRVALVAENSVDRVAWMFAIWWLGAIEVAVNFELRGPLLNHVLTDSDPILILCQSKFIDAVQAETTVSILAFDDLNIGEIPKGFAETLEESNKRIKPGDLGTILYTSGTTGPAKGVMLPRAYFSNLGAIWAANNDMRRGEVGYFPLPFFHVDGHILISACLQSRSALSFRERFSLSEYWNDVERFGAAWAVGVGSMLSMLAETNPGAKAASLRRIMGAPIPDAAYEKFEDELNIPVTTLYGQTECDVVTLENADRKRRGSCGSIHEFIDVRIVDSNDVELPVGEVGEIIYRPMQPYLTALGYWRRPEYTLEAWRNLWFHSGDTGRIDEDGFLYFIGRKTDSFRRRGENISAWELESTLAGAPNIRECIAIAVEDEHGGEDEIKVFVVPVEGTTFDIASFSDYARSSLPRYAIPQWVAVTSGDAFVRSPGTGVVQKHLLSKEVGHPHAVKITR